MSTPPITWVRGNPPTGSFLSCATGYDHWAQLAREINARRAYIGQALTTFTYLGQNPSDGDLVGQDTGVTSKWARNMIETMLDEMRDSIQYCATHTGTKAGLDYEWVDSDGTDYTGPTTVIDRADSIHDWQAMLVEIYAIVDALRYLSGVEFDSTPGSPSGSHDTFGPYVLEEDEGPIHDCGDFMDWPGFGDPDPAASAMARASALWSSLIPHFRYAAWRGDHMVFVYKVASVWSKNILNARLRLLFGYTAVGTPTASTTIWGGVVDADFFNSPEWGDVPRDVDFGGSPSGFEIVEVDLKANEDFYFAIESDLVVASGTFCSWVGGTPPVTPGSFFSSKSWGVMFSALLEPSA